MALLDHCWLCSLRVAASVLAVYTAVAYLIAFFIEFWLIWEVEGLVPYVEFILTSGYFLTFILTTILVRGISERRLSHLIIWMLGMIAMIVPEGGLVIFMSINFWKIHSINGLTEMTFWICRLIVNICAILCMQSLYSTWKEENEVITSLRDLNKVSIAKAKARRTSISSDRVNILNSFMNPGYSSAVEYEKTPPVIKRSDSMISINSPRSPRAPSPATSEFDASKFRPNGWPGIGGWPGNATPVMKRMGRSRSLGDLSTVTSKPPPPPVLPPPPMHMIQPPPPRLPPHLYYGSLDRPRRPLVRSNSVAGIPHAPPYQRVNSGYFGSLIPPTGYLLDPFGNIVYLQDPRAFFNNGLFMPRQMSHVSLPESDDTHKYRDVAL